MAARLSAITALGLNEPKLIAEMFKGEAE